MSSTCSEWMSCRKHESLKVRLDCEFDSTDSISYESNVQCIHTSIIT